MFHQIYELMVLGMHPLISYLRRNRSAPSSETYADRAKGSGLRAKSRSAPEDPILASAAGATYANVHSTRFTTGEIRGAINDGHHEED